MYNIIFRRPDLNLHFLNFFNGKISLLLFFAKKYLMTHPPELEYSGQSLLQETKKIIYLQHKL